MKVDSFDKKPDIRSNRREDGKLQREELEALLQRVEEMELQHRKKLEQWKTLKRFK